MTDHPILMTAPMVRAILAGRKTQTRRLAWRGGRKYWAFCDPDQVGLNPSHWQKVMLRDRLWIREAWRHSATGVWAVSDARRAGRGGVEYKADQEDWHGGFSPIYMPREFSRITLMVTDVKQERVQEISEADALAEGIDRLQFPERGDWGWPQRKYRDLWQSIHTKSDALWEVNPEVVAISFRPVLSNIDQLEEAA